LLSEIAPGLKRVAIIFNPDPLLPVSSFMPSIEMAARSLKVELITAPVHSDVEIETSIIALGREPGTGLVLFPDAFTLAHRALIILIPAKLDRLLMHNGGIMRRSARPWKMLGMSRATWYRHGKPTEKPKRYRQADVAKILGVSVRTIQRDAAGRREKVVARAHELFEQGHGFKEAFAMARAEITAEREDDRQRPPDAADEYLQRRIEWFEQTKAREKSV
jgi:hypothetical protein